MDVWAYSSTDEVELFLNGRSLGRKQKPDGKFHLMWRVPYKPGTLRAVSYENGEQVMMKEVITAGGPAQIKLSADRPRITADSRDLSFVTVEILDETGNPVPKAENMIRFEIEGPGAVVG